MPEVDTSDNAAVGLEESLKEFDNPMDGVDDNFLSGIEAAAKEQEQEDDTSQPGDPEGEPAKDNAEEEPAKGEEDSEEKDWNPMGDDADAEPEAKEESEPEEEEAPQPKTAEDWSAFKAAKKELKQQFKDVSREKADLESEITKLREQTAELAELREQAVNYEAGQKELAISRVEGTDDYKRTVAAPLKDLDDQVSAIAKAADVDVNKLFDAMTEVDPTKRRAALKEATEDMDHVDQSDVFRMANETQVILAKREEIRANAQEAAKEAKANSEAQDAASAKKSREEFSAAADTVAQELRKRVPYAELAEGETEEGVFASLASKTAETDFDGLSSHKKAFAVASGIMTPRLLKQLTAANEQITKLESRLSRKNAKRPSVGSSADPDPSDPDAEFMDGLFGDSRTLDIAANLKSLGVT